MSSVVTRRGIAVLPTNPCDPYGARPANYPHLWMWPSVLGLGQGSTVVPGVLVGVVFLVAALAVLPRGATAGDAALYGLAVCAPAVMLGVERGNVDIALFALVALGILLLRLRLAFGDRLLKRLQPQLQLFLQQAFGSGAETHPRQPQQQVAQSVILRQQSVPLSERGVAFSERRQHQRAQRLDSLRQALDVVGRRIGHVRILCGNSRLENPPCCLNSRPIDAVKQRGKLHR